VLFAKLAEKRTIEQRIEEAQLKRGHADKAVALLALDETVARFFTRR
jgi:hypothetical protein